MKNGSIKRNTLHALGRQQTTRLHALREAKDQFIHQQHLERETSARNDGESTPRRTTIEAIIETRELEKSSKSTSTATKLRQKIEAARGGIQTERSERPQTHIAPLVPSFSASKQRPVTHGTEAASHSRTTRRIVAIRRPLLHHPTEKNVKRRQSKEEIEWLEKHRQFHQRIGLLERECESAWQSFYASAAGHDHDAAVSQLMTAMHKQNDELTHARVNETQQLHGELHQLRMETHAIAEKVCRMRDGHEFYAELQESMASLEDHIAAFRQNQRHQYETMVMEEKAREYELQQFLQTIEAWESEDIAIKKKDKTSVVDKKQSKPSAQVNDQEEEDDDMTTKSSDEVDMMERVRRLNEQIAQMGGHKGGWDDREHGLFTAILAKCQMTDKLLLQHHAVVAEHPEIDPTHANDAPVLDYEGMVSRFVRKCTKKIVTRTPTAIRQHLEWYVRFLELHAHKKQVIQTWKHKKEQERHELLQQGLARDLSETTTAYVVSQNNQDEQDQSKKPTTSLKSKQQLRQERARERKAMQLQLWREEKERKERERLDELREQQNRQEQEDAKRRQAQLDTKQKILLYKLRKEEEQAPSRSGSTAATTPPAHVSKDELMERSRRAIASAKAKRAKLEELEAKRQKQLELPERPVHSAGSPVDSTSSGSSSAGTSPLDRLYRQPTKAFEARAMSSSDVREREYARQRQSAHSTYIPGVEALNDVKVKSFGHVPIQPRAIPAWRRNL